MGGPLLGLPVSQTRKVTDLMDDGGDLLTGESVAPELRRIKLDQAIQRRWEPAL
jgi:hypothetical protein